jgi:hypothetical protein
MAPHPRGQKFTYLIFVAPASWCRLYLTVFFLCFNQIAALGKIAAGYEHIRTLSFIRREEALQGVFLSTPDYVPELR